MSGKRRLRRPDAPPSAPPPPSPSRAAWVVFAIALALRLVHVFFIQRSMVGSVLLGDALTYDNWAQEIARGNWLGSEVFYQAPLYPYLLGALFRIAGHSLLTVRILQALFGATACALLTIAGRRLFGTAAGWGAGLTLALFAPAVFFDGLVQKSSLDGLLCAWLLYAIAAIATSGRARDCLLAGLALGCLALSRENALLLLPLVALWVWDRSRRPSHVLVLLAGAVLLLAPVALRNRVVGGEWALTTAQFGPNLYIGNHDGATGAYVPLRPGRGNAAVERRDATELAQQALGRTLRPGEVSGYWRGRALQWISAQPARAIELVGRKLGLTWNRVEIVDTEDLDTHARWSPVLFVLAPIAHFGVLAPLAALGLWRERRRRRELWVLPAAIATYTLTVAAFYVLGRYRYPLVPLLALYVGAALAGIAAWWSGLTKTQRGVAVGIVAGTAIVCNLPLVERAPMRALTATNLAIALDQQGASAAAEASYREALRIDPANADALSNLGILMAKRGEHGEAIELFRRALTVDPRHAPALTNLGLSLSALGRADESMTALRKAVEIDPLNADACYNLGTALARAGDAANAMHWLRESIRQEPDNAAAHNNLGILLASADRVEEAIAEFHAALGIQPDFAEARANLDHALALVR